MRNILLSIIVLFTLYGCISVPRALNDVTIGMSIDEFMILSKNQATLESSSDGRTVYRYKWASPDESYYIGNTTFYYFFNGKLVRFDAGVITNPPPQLKLNYNLN